MWFIDRNKFVIESEKPATKYCLLFLILRFRRYCLGDPQNVKLLDMKFDCIPKIIIPVPAKGSIKQKHKVFQNFPSSAS